MSLLNAASRKQQLNWAREVRDVVRQGGDPQAVSQIDTAIEQFESERFCLAVLGKVKRGKSTLINALLGRSDDLAAPVDRLPASNAISRFRWNVQEAVTIFYRDGRKEPTVLERVREFATEELNPGNRKGVELLEIWAPFPSLDREVELVDTPGAGSVHEHHDALLHAFIPHADAVIFLVTARMPLDQDELELLHSIKSYDIPKIFFVVNRIDETSESDLADAIQHNIRLLAEVGVTISKVHRISAKLAFQGKLAESGVPELLQDLGEFLATQKGTTLANRLRSRVTQIAGTVLAELVYECDQSGKSRAELDSERRRLEAEKQQLGRERELAEREFRSAWNKALLSFEHGVAGAESSLRDKLANDILSAKLTDVGSLAKRLPTRLQQTIDEVLGGPSRELEQQILQATEKLQTAYPRIQCLTLRVAPLRRSNDDALIKGAVAGAAVSAIGGGLVAAGGVTAAGITAANAAALAATTTVTAPSVIGSLLASVPHIGGTLAALGTGTATVSAPTAFTAMPLWVAMSGPVGWTLVGIGVLTVPFAWRTAKLRDRDRLEAAAQEHLGRVFAAVRKQRIPQLRALGESITTEFQIGLDRQLNDLQDSLEELTNRPFDPIDIARRKEICARMRALLAET